MMQSDKTLSAPLQDAGNVTAEEIREQVKRIVRSRMFAQSRRMQRFLQFSVEQVLEGEEDSLKEYSVALAVFDKPQSFDPRLDPIVRVEAGRLRSKLREYYEGPGRSDPVRITYRKRSYVPFFNYQASAREDPNSVPRAVPRESRTAVASAKSRIAGGEGGSRAIAVLPFINLSVSRKHEYFSDAITAEIINVLNQTVPIDVVARTSVLRFKDTEEDIRKIAHSLGADAVMEGSVRLAGKRVRVAVQLANASTGYQIWSQTYDREIADIFDVQKDLAQSIAQALKIQLRSSRSGSASLFGTENSEAYHLYLRGRHFLKRSLRKDLRSAIRFFDKAVSCDPDYALAYVGLADASAALSWSGAMSPKKCWRKSAEMVQKALEIDADLGYAHVASAHAKAACEWNWEEAERQFLQGLKLNPSYAGGHRLYSLTCLAPQGRLTQAQDEIGRALDLNPGSAAISADSGWILYCQRQYASALDQLSRSIRLDPLFYRSHLYAGYVHQQQLDLDEAIKAFAKARELSKQEAIAEAAAGRCLALMGEKKAALCLAENLVRRSRKTYISPVDIAVIHIGLGNIEKACVWLEKAFTQRCPRLIHLNVDPAYDSIKSNPKFLNFLERIHVDYVHS